MAIYGFARLTDDIGDEAPGDRVAQLDWLESELELALTGQANHRVLQRLGATIQATGIEPGELRNLIEANRVDQRVHRYASFEDLLGYCRLSAAPIGRLVLTVFGTGTTEQLALSDDVCAGLQVAEHLQDVGEDARLGRVYLPQQDMERFGCTEEDLTRPSASPPLRQLVLFEAARARRLLSAGVPLAHSLPFRQRIAVAGYTAGGLAALDAIERAGGDVLAHHCKPSAQRFVRRLVAVLAGRSRQHAGQGQGR
jgi:squalene synthase HpnC